jgi:hypothetical protein
MRVTVAGERRKNTSTLADTDVLLDIVVKNVRISSLILYV